MVAVPSAHDVSSATATTDSIRSIGVTVLLLVRLAAPGLRFPRTRLAKRAVTSTTKATETNSTHPRVERGATPDLNRRLNTKSALA